MQHVRSVSQLRSLFMFGVIEKPSMHTLFPSGFKLLSVLDLESAPLNMVPVEVVNLFFLKYLSLRNTKVTFDNTCGYDLIKDTSKSSPKTL